MFRETSYPAVADAGASGGRATSQHQVEVAGYIQDMAEALRAMARNAGLQHLSHLLSMVELEAREYCEAKRTESAA